MASGRRAYQNGINNGIALSILLIINALVRKGGFEPVSGIHTNQQQPNKSMKTLGICTPFFGRLWVVLCPVRAQNTHSMRTVCRQQDSLASAGWLSPSLCLWWKLGHHHRAVEPEKTIEFIRQALDRLKASMAQLDERMDQLTQK